MFFKPLRNYSFTQEAQASSLLLAGTKPGFAQRMSGNSSFSFLSRIFYVLLAVIAVFPSLSRASGVLPETSAVIINEAQKGGSINVKNTEKVPVLLFTKVVDLADDPSQRLIVTQPVARLEPGQTQRVRFVLNTDGPLQREHIKRVYFEGVAEQSAKGGQVSVTVRQDLPVIIVPKGLKEKRDLWTDLNWSLSGNNLKVTNTGKQVVRLAQQVKLQPSGTAIILNKTYLLPGETLTAAAPAGSRLTGQQVQFSPVSRYGFDVGPQKATLAGK